MKTLHSLVLLVGLALPASLPAQVISTVAGGDTVGPIDALDAALREPVGVAIDGDGNRYIASAGSNRVYKVDAAGVLTVVAGNGIYGFSGDGGSAKAARLASPYSVALDTNGNLYIADQGNQRIRRVDAATGTISTVAGNGSAAFGGDGGPATSAAISYPRGIAMDGGGNLYIADYENHRIRRVSAATGLISTAAGNGTSGFGGDGGQATSATLSYPVSVGVDSSGNLYIADTSNNRVRKVDATTGTIDTIAGNGSGAFSGDGGPAISASLAFPRGLDIDSAGSVYVADTGNNRVRKIEAGTGTIHTVAGNGSYGFTGDGGAATGAGFNYPYDVAVDSGGNLYIADRDNGRIRKVAFASGIISSVAGGAIGDGQPATAAFLNAPWDSATDAAGNLYVADRENQRVRKVDATTGLITTVAGTGSYGYNGDGGPAVAANLGCPSGVDLDGAGNLYIADTCNNRIRKVTAGTGVISTVAGDGSFGSGGDGGSAISASLYYPHDVAVDVSGNLYVMDTGNYRVRRINAATGVISTVAGNGATAFSGDGGPAVSASIGFALGLTVDRTGNLYVADTGNNRVRRVDATTGVIGTVAGSGSYGFSGDGGPAVNASLYYPYDVAADADGNIFVADFSNGRIRKVEATTALISTVAGDGSFGFGGDGGPATSASFAYPIGVDIDDSGSLYVADLSNGRIRKVPGVGAPVDRTPPIITPLLTGTLGNNGWYRSNVGLIWSVSDPESAVSTQSGCEDQAVTTDSAGTTFTCTATSLGGTASKSITIKRDTTKPTISITTPSGGAYLLNASVLAGYTCSDALSTIATCSGTVANGSPLSTNSPGSFALTVSATDMAGNTATSSTTYSVTFGFIGFLQPVDNLPSVNSMNAGRTVPVKWQLLDGNGAYIPSLSTFKSLGSYAAACDASVPTADIEEIVATGGTTLRYDSTSNQFVFNWSTVSSWKGRCRMLVLELADGKRTEALFRFK